MAQLVTVLLRKPHATQGYALCASGNKSSTLCLQSSCLSIYVHAVPATLGTPKFWLEKFSGLKRRLRLLICPMIHQEDTALVFAMYSTSTTAVPGQIA